MTLLQALEEFGEYADTEYRGLADAQRDDLAWLLVGIRDLRADLAALYDQVQTDLLSIAGKKAFAVENLGEVSVHKKTNRTKWDNEQLTRKLVALALDERIVNESSGEYESAHEAVARVLSECSRPTWRLTPLRARHIPIDEYCVEEDAGFAVQLPPRQT